MLDIFNRKAKIVNEELRKQLEERDTLIEWWREEGKRLEKEVDFKTKEVIRQIRRIKELTTETSVLRKRVEDIEKENKQLRVAIEDYGNITQKQMDEKVKLQETIKRQYEENEKLRDELTLSQRQKVFGITPANIETFRMLRGMALNGRNKRIRNKYINKMAESMEAVFKEITE